MSSELTSALPRESESQRIGRLANKCFQANTPNSWLYDSVDGDNDYGYDYQVQLVTEGLVKDSFRVQLKGTTSPALNADGSEYSISLDIATVNYYCRATEPVLLVLSDLSFDIDRPKNCPLYYQWIQKDLRRIRERGVQEDQKYVTFHVPVANRLDETTDLSADIDAFRRVAKLGEQLDIIVEREMPSVSAYERAELVSKLAPGFEARSATLFEAITDAPKTSWVEAPEGTLQWYLLEATNALRAGNSGEAQRALDVASPLLAAAKPLEQADYWHVVGRLRVFSLDDIGARDAFAKACHLTEDAPRHLAPWVEAELRLRFRINGPNDFTDVIARLTSTDPVIRGMRARLLAAQGQFQEASLLAEAIEGLEGYIVQAIILTMQARSEEVISVCDAGLSVPSCRESSKQFFLILRARARFSLAVGGISTDEPEVMLPMTGPAGAKPDLLRAAWNDIASAAASLRLSGWPGNVELLADIWSATASMLGLQKSALPLMAEAGDARPTLLTLQAGIESLAAQIGDFPLALKANARQSSGQIPVLRRISLLHFAGQHQACVDLMAIHEAELPDDHPMFGYVTTLAVLSSDRLVRADLATRWVQRLEAQPCHAPQLALLKYFRVLSQNLLAKDAALVDLNHQYEVLGRPQSIGVQLFYELDPTDVKQAERCIELAQDLKKVRLLDIDGDMQLAQALTTLERWNDLLELSNQERSRFNDHDRLSAIGALALDKLGRTGEAHALLQSLIEKSDADALALNTYLSITSRSGFTNEAIACIERVLASEKEPSRQIECLRHLFNLIHLSEPANPRLLDIAWAIGQRADPDDETQEGLFLVTMFTATLPAEISLDEARRSAFHRRMLEFSKKFPGSKIIKMAKLPDNASIDDLMRMLREVLGDNEEQLRWRTKIQNELFYGVMPVPYAWRPRHILDGISDLPTLWEISKKSKWGDRQLHLTMVAADWKPVSIAEMRGSVPLLDLTALMVINDLGLFDALFQLFPKIAVGKATLLELQRLLSPMSGGLIRQKCLSIQNNLKTRFELVEQPGLQPPDGESFRTVRWSTEEVVEAAKQDGYMIYADDVLFRIYANPPAGNPPSICTLDVLSALDEAGILTATEVARHLATLCSWRVTIVVPERYQLAILPETLGSAKSVSHGIDCLRADSLCNAMFNGLWTPEKRYDELQALGGSLLRSLIENPKNSIISISALAGFWLGKARLHQKSPMPVTRLIALLIMQAAFDERSVDQDMSRRLWSVYRSLVEEEYGDRMDDDKYRGSIKIIGEVAAEMDQRASLEGERAMRERLEKGLTPGTSDHERFSNSYSTMLLKMVKQNLSER